MFYYQFSRCCFFFFYKKSICCGLINHTNYYYPLYEFINRKKKTVKLANIYRFHEYFSLFFICQQEQRYTKIPRFDVGAIPRRIPRPTALIRPNPIAVTTSKLIKPSESVLNQVADDKPSAIDPSLRSISNGINHPVEQAAAYPRKALIRRYGASDKIKIKNLPILMSKQLQQPTTYQTKQSTLTVHHEANENSRRLNETHQITKPADSMNVTKQFASMAATSNDITTSMERNLTRSNTFVCDEADAGQTKLLSVTHNINAMQMAESSQDGKQLYSVKERTKRSLSPIPNDTINAAKRKSVQSIVERKLSTGPLSVSTPRQCNADAETKFLFFGTQISDTKQRESLEMQTFALDRTVAKFESAKRNNSLPDAVNVTKPTKQHNHVADLTQTIVIHAAEECEASAANAYTTHVMHTIDNDGKMHDATITRSNAPNTAKNEDGDVTKTILGKVFGISFYYSHCCCVRFLLPLP